MAIKKSEYNVNGENRTKSEIRNIVKSPNTTVEDLAKMEFNNLKTLQLSMKEEGEFGKQTKLLVQIEKDRVAITNKQISLNNEAKKESLKARKEGMKVIMEQGKFLKGHAVELGKILHAHAVVVARARGQAEPGMDKFTPDSETFNFEKRIKAAQANVQKLINMYDGPDGLTTRAQKLNETTRDGKIAEIEQNREIERQKLLTRNMELINLIAHDEKMQEIFVKRFKLIDDTYTNELNAAKHQKTISEDERKALIKTAELRRDTALAELEAMTKLQALINNQLLATVDNFAGKLQGRVKEGFDSLWEAIDNGTLTMQNFKEGFRDWIYSVLQDFRNAIFEEFVTKPLQDLIKKMITGTQDISAAENMEAFVARMTEANGTMQERAEAFAKANVQQVFVTNWPAKMGGGGTVPFKPPQGTDKDGGLDPEVTKGIENDKQQIGQSLKGIGTMAVGTFAAVFAATGDFKKSMIATFLAMFLKIMIDSLMAKMFVVGAGGGYVGRGSAVQRFAAGGLTTASAPTAARDRVPALLEPGEFVIRKPMAKAIGGPALQRMNATGQTPPGNVSVNVTNKGTAQQVQSATPKFDASGMVVEIVMKDLQNNGPIKQSLRSGGKR